MGHERHHQRASTAVRLTFTNDEGELELVDARRARMRVPAGERIDENDKRIGNWVEVRDAEGEVLYRRRTRPVAAETVEVPRAGGRFERVPSRAPQVVSALVPDVEGARRVLLRERRPAGEERGESEEVDHASVSLDEVDAIGERDTREDDSHDGGEDDANDDHEGDGSRPAGGR